MVSTSTAQARSKFQALACHQLQSQKSNKKGQSTCNMNMSSTVVVRLKVNNGPNGRINGRIKPGCGVGVGGARSRVFFGWSWNRIPKKTKSRNGCGSRIFYPTPTPEVQLNHFLHRTPKLGVLTRACWSGTISFETSIDALNSCCVP